jgi:hypothetical protein
MSGIIARHCSALGGFWNATREKAQRRPLPKFNTYRFAEYKEKVIDLLLRVCMVSVETMRIVKEMEG